jgi:hypothetical protein
MQHFFEKIQYKKITFKLEVYLSGVVTFLPGKLVSTCTKQQRAKNIKETIQPSKLS